MKVSKVTGYLLLGMILVAGILFFVRDNALAEDVTITTYYPAPYGVYGELCLKTGDTTVTDGDDLGTIEFKGEDDGTYTDKIGAVIRAEASGTWDGATQYDAETELQFFTQSNGATDSLGTPNMVIDSTGNVGIGTTDFEAWHSNYLAIEFPISAMMIGKTNDGLFFNSNTYFDTGSEWKYKTTNEAAYYRIYDGTHRFSVAASGTIDTAITWTDAMIITNAGNVGIGTTNPSSGKLEIVNAETASDYDGIVVTNNDTFSYGLYIDGDGTYGIALMANADNNCYENGVGTTCSLNDYAEMMEFSEMPEDGDVIVIDEENPGLLKVATTSYGTVVGIASEEPAMVIGSYGITIKGWNKDETTRDGYYTYPLAIAGRKIVKISTENGIPEPGDYVTSSTTRGLAMKATEPGPVIGKVLWFHDNSDPNEPDRALVIITLSWYGGGPSKIGTCSSLREHKKDIEDLELGLDTVLQLQPKTFYWKQPEEGDEEINPYQDLGFIAEEVEEIVPILTTHYDGELVGVRYRQYTAVLTKAIQEQQKEIEQLKARLAALEAKL